MALEKEQETYRRLLPELEQHQGKYVLIHGDELVDLFGSYEDAIRGGYRKFGPDDPFLVKLIEATEEVHFISRLWEPVEA